jgi:FHS family L-fucose permease-like MFS transporter
LFVLWGAGHRLYDTLGSQFTHIARLDTALDVLMRTAYAMVYMIGAIPAALYSQRFGYKAAILFGLGCVVIGCFTFYPAAELGKAPYLVVCSLVLAVGWIFLEVAANPLIAEMGPPETFVWRLNVAQAFYPAGSLIGVIMGHWMVNTHLVTPDSKASFAIGHPYILLGAGVLLLAFLVEEIPFPPVASERIRGGLHGGFRGLLRQRAYLAAWGAQFFGVVALTGSWLVTVLLFKAALPDKPHVFFSDSLIWVMLAFLAGRAAGCILMRLWRPSVVLAGFSAGGILACLVALFTSGLTAAMAMLAASFFISIAWPTVVALGIQDQGEKMKLATALLIVAGALGAVAFHNLRGFLPAGSILISTAPLIGFAVVLAFAWSRTIAPKR